MSYVVEFSLEVKPGHYQDVVDLYSQFAHDFMAIDPHLINIHIVGDSAAGLVRGIGIYDSQEAAEAVNSDVIFATFSDAITPLISAPPNRVLLDLLHTWSR